MLGAIDTVSGVHNDMKTQKEQRLRRMSAARQQEDTFMEGLARLRRERKLSVLLMKMQVGKKLSPGEMQYLRQHAGGAYEKAAKIDREREGYKQALKRCRSKGEVRRLLSSGLLALGGAPKAGEAAAAPPAEGGAALQGTAAEAPGPGRPAEGPPAAGQQVAAPAPLPGRAARRRDARRGVAARRPEPPSRGAVAGPGAWENGGAAAQGAAMPSGGWREQGQARKSPPNDGRRQVLHTRA